MISYLKSLLIFILIFTWSAGFSQAELNFSGNIDWILSESRRDLSDTSIPSFDGHSMGPKFKDLPYVHRIEKLNGPYSDCSISLVELEVAPLHFSDFSSRQVRVLQDEFRVLAKIVPSKSGSYLVLDILPFRKNRQTDQVEKLLSYSVHVTLSGTSQAAYKVGASNSVLADGTWFKIAVGKDGVYKLDRNILTELGIDVETINPKNINIYGNGGTLLPFDNSVFRHDDLALNNIFVAGEDDERFNAGDYILFYGKGPDTWTLQEGSDPVIFEHQKHYYSDSAYYYIRVDDVAGSRIPNVDDSNLSPTEEITKFHDRQYFESNITNLNQSGREFFGEYFGANASYNFSFDFPNITSDDAIFKMQCASRSISESSSFFATFSGNTVELPIGTVGSTATSNVARVGDVIHTFSPDTSPITVGVSYNQANPTAEGWLDYIELNVTRDLIMSGTQLHFRNAQATAPLAVAKFFLGEAQLVQEIWDVTDVTQVKRIPFSLEGSDAVFQVAHEEMHEFVAFTGGNFLTPIAVGPVENQDLHALEGVDMIILSSPLLVNESEMIADLHREEGMVVEVVTPMPIYNEFSSGNPDVTGIKMFMKHLYDKADGNPELQLRYLLIMGDGSYSGNKSVNSINSYTVITYQSANSISPTNSYVSDDYYGFLGDAAGEDVNDDLNIGVGRIPAESAEEAADYVNKLKIYMSQNASADGGVYCLGDANPSPYGSWRNDVVIISDDQDGNGAATEVFHMIQSDEHATTIYENYNDYNVIKIYADAYQQVSTPGGERYPSVVTAIKQRVEKGALLVQYTGHGGEKGWAHERILDIPTIQDWTNISRLPLFMTATCELARYDDPSFKSAGEILVLSPTGGAIAMLTTTRIVFSAANQALATAFYDVVFEDETITDLRLGDVMRLTKNSAPSSPNKRNFSLLGDPAMRLSYPQMDVYTTHINGNEISNVPDTVRSLEQVVVKGYVGDHQGQVLSDFNGFVYPTVYDKMTLVNVLNNDNGTPYAFDVFKNIVYKGKVSVINGEFEFTFVIPKDINYNFGLGRISYYAVSGSKDAHGFSEEFIIGGASEEVESNNVGPDIELFMNDSNFVYGGITSQDPILLARVFDENGINTVGNGIGHDLVATLDGQTTDQIVLNDFYEADLDTYRSGEVRYQLSNLSEGTHSLKVKVWDVHNNSSESYTEFVVAANTQLALDHVLNYPNPFSTRTEFFFEHNQACDLLDVRIQIFTVGGKIVKTIEKQVLSDGFRSEGIVWDGKDDFGDNIGKGVYVYKVDVRTPDGQRAEKFEKLVILK